MPSSNENPYSTDKVKVSQTHGKPKKEPRNFADSSDEEYGEETPGGSAAETPGNPDEGTGSVTEGAGAAQANSDEDDDHLRDDIEGVDKASTYSAVNNNNIST